MDGGCLCIWLHKPLTDEQMLLMKQYELYLQNLGLGYSFSYDLRLPDIKTRFEMRQVKRVIGYIPEQEIFICGLADPMFRATEAILKYFNGCLSISFDISGFCNPIGKCYAIRKRNKHFFLFTRISYHLVDWEFVAGYWNRFDDQGIRDVYSIKRCSDIKNV